MPLDHKEFFFELSRICDCQSETIDVYSAASYIYRDGKKDSWFPNSIGFLLFLFVAVSE